jgi:hypothetical protein
MTSGGLLPIPAAPSRHRQAELRDEAIGERPVDVTLPGGTVHPRQQDGQLSPSYLDPRLWRQIKPTLPIAPHNGSRCLVGELTIFVALFFGHVSRLVH